MDVYLSAGGQQIPCPKLGRTFSHAVRNREAL